MINLQICCIYFFQVDEALAAIFFDQLLFDLFGKTGASAKPSKLFLAGISKTVGCNLPAIGSLDAKGFKLNAQFPNIPAARGGWS
jgi:hypothetical protein